MKFEIDKRRSATAVFARDLVVGDTLCEKLNRYCETRCVDPVIREEGRVIAVTVDRQDGWVQLHWRTPYGENKDAVIGSYQPVMVIR